MHLSKPVECMTPRVNANVNYELWVIIICQYRFIHCNKCTILVGVVIMGESKHVKECKMYGHHCTTLSILL